MRSSIVFFSPNSWIGTLLENGGSWSLSVLKYVRNNLAIGTLVAENIAILNISFNDNLRLNSSFLYTVRME